MKLILTPLIFLLSFAAQAELYRYDFAIMQAGHVQTMTASNDVRGYAVYVFISRRPPYTSPVMKSSVINVPQPSGAPWFAVEFPSQPGLYLMAAATCDDANDYTTCTEFDNTENAQPRGLLFLVE